MGVVVSENPDVPGAERAPIEERVFALVASHRGTGLEFLARLESGSLRITSAEVAASADVAGAVVLSTCNRFEVYVEIRAGSDPAVARRRVLSVISVCSGVPVRELGESLDYLVGTAMTEHLFLVGAGLDSAVVGEREIAGQLRRSLTAAQESETASGALIRLFQAASRVARDVGSLTTLGEAGRSMVSVALDLAVAKLGGRGRTDLSVVVIGTGAYAGFTLALLAARYGANVSVFSWSGRAGAFAAARRAAALTMSELPAAIRGANVVIGCSGRGARLGAEDFRRFRQGAEQRLVVVDLALSRDFEPSIGELPGVDVITLEDVRLASPGEHSDGVRQATVLVRQATLRFVEDRQARLLDPAIVALRAHMQQVLAGELARVKNHHGCTATSEAVEFALRRVVRQLMHVPTARARELAAAGRQDDYTAALEALYGLGVEPDSRALPVPAAGLERPGRAQAS